MVNTHINQLSSKRKKTVGEWNEASSVSTDFTEMKPHR